MSRQSTEEMAWANKAVKEYLIPQVEKKGGKEFQVKTVRKPCHVSLIKLA